jgi:hypothetical protein
MFTTPGQRRGMSQGSGLTVHERLGTHQDAILAATSSCGFRDDWDIRNMAQRGAFVGKFTFDSTSTQGYVLSVVPLTPSLSYGSGSGGNGSYYPGHAAYYSQFFQRWRGTLKLVLEFVTTVFTTASIRVTHNSYNEVSADVEEKSHVSTVAEIRGYTVYKRKFPYISLKPWTQVIGFRTPTQTPLTNEFDMELDSVELSVINPPRTTDGTGSSQVWCNVYIAGGEDIDFKDYIGFKVRTTEAEADAPPSKQSMKSLFSGEFPTIHPALTAREYGLVRSETETSILELCKRETRLMKDAVTDWPTNPSAAMALTNISALIRCFQFYRGSVNYRFCFAAPTQIGLDTTTYSGNWATQLSSWNAAYPLLAYPTNFVSSPNTVNPDVCVNIPWQEDSIGLPFEPETEEDDNMNNYVYFTPLGPGIGGNDVFGSLGDDFQLASVHQPPKYVVTVALDSDDELSPPAEHAQQPQKLPPDIDRGIIELPSSSSRKNKGFNIKSLFAKEQKL